MVAGHGEGHLHAICESRLARYENGDGVPREDLDAGRQQRRRAARARLPRTRREPRRVQSLARARRLTSNLARGAYRLRALCTRVLRLTRSSGRGTEAYMTVRTSV